MRPLIGMCEAVSLSLQVGGPWSCHSFVLHRVRELIRPPSLATPTPLQQGIRNSLNPDTRRDLQDKYRYAQERDDDQ